MKENPGLEMESSAAVNKNSSGSRIYEKQDLNLMKISTEKEKEVEDILHIPLSDSNKKRKSLKRKQSINSIDSAQKEKEDIKNLQPTSSNQLLKKVHELHRTLK